MTQFTNPEALQILREEQAANDAFFAEMDAKIKAAQDDVAHARLMAAAPELLEALQWALDVMEIHKVGEGCGTQKAARAAIAKAKGE